MRISFVIPAYNEEAYIGTCLESIVSLRDSAVHQIIVVDNASTDKTAEIAGSFPGVTVVREPTKGIARARQRGLEAATGDFLAAIDADTYVTPEWLRRVKKHFDAGSLDCLVGDYFYYDLSPWKRWLKSAAERMLRLLHALSGTPGSCARGGNTVYRISALKAAGGFNEDIPYFGEDVDVLLRIRKIGTIVHDPRLLAPSSARRINAEGFFKMMLLYKLSLFWQRLTGKPLPHGAATDWR